MHDRLTGVTTRVSVNSAGVQGNADSSKPSVSADGRYAAFQSIANNFGGQGGEGVFVHDGQTGVTTSVSVNSAGLPANSNSDYPSISADGRYVSFDSYANNLVPGDTNGVYDIFVRDRGAASAFAPFCFGHGSAPGCPCANNGSSGHGCENSAATGGALLAATGVASFSNDTVQLTSSGELPSSLSIVLQGNSVIWPVNFGDGLRCAGGSLRRLYVKGASGGIINVPQVGDPSLALQSAYLGDLIPLGATRIYQVYYRDSNLGFCPGGFNVSNAMLIAWGA